ncbi:hypothetical protein O0I10_004181 [Lichtheimia ornata]|uniref:Uncharacterized protein n=1 Tax=Lichtheimia ornata TaxID=688661 RepID=A0AAD7V7Y0_9FUNG|nr:uncharacterized protein O0I10_004181 [Lichtheimia ornata]KAJ8659955.1 hypothetical protein O0I10_004181 [Lichtheimia ornata]
MNTISYPGGLKAYTELACMKARLIPMRFVEQCAVLQYRSSWLLHQLPSLIEKELGSDIANKIDCTRLYDQTKHDVIFHIHFETRDACLSAVKKIRKRQLSKDRREQPSFKLYPMFTSKKRYTLLNLKLTLDSPTNAMKEINQAVASTKRRCIDIILGTDDVFKKYNATASIVLQGEGIIDVTLYGKQYTLEPVIRGYLYCERCKFLNDHDTDECPHQPEDEEQPQDEKQGEEFENIDNNSSDNNSTQETIQK